MILSPLTAQSDPQHINGFRRLEL